MRPLSNGGNSHLTERRNRKGPGEMSKGLGRLQKAILDYLQARGKPEWFIEIAYSVTYKLKDEEIPPTTAEYEAIRRAVRSLEKRGLVKCALGDPLYQWETRYRLICWLPEHKEPETRKELTGEFVEEIILQVVNNATIDSDGYFHNQYRFDLYEPENIPYKLVTKEVGYRLRELKYFDGCYAENRVSTAINRAIYRLMDKGLIKAYWKKMGRWGWIVPIDKCCDVNNKSYKTTLIKDTESAQL